MAALSTLSTFYTQINEATSARVCYTGDAEIARPDRQDGTRSNSTNEQREGERHFGPKTLRTQDISALVPKCPMDTSAPVLKCLGHFGTTYKSYTEVTY